MSSYFSIDLDELEEDIKNNFPDLNNTRKRLAAAAFNTRERFSEDNLRSRNPNYEPDNTDWEIQQFIGNISTSSYSSLSDFGTWYFSLKVFFDRYEVYLRDRLVFYISDTVHVCDQIKDVIRGIAKGINNLSTGERVAYALSHKELNTATWGKNYTYLSPTTLRIPKELDNDTLGKLWQLVKGTRFFSALFEVREITSAFCLLEHYNSKLSVYAAESSEMLMNVLSTLNIVKGNRFIANLSSKDKQKLALTDIHLEGRMYMISAKTNLIYDCTADGLCTDPSIISKVKTINELASSIA